MNIVLLYLYYKCVFNFKQQIKKGILPNAVWFTSLCSNQKSKIEFESQPTLCQLSQNNQSKLESKCVSLLFFVIS